MGIENVFPIWNKLTENEKQMLKDSAVKRRVEKGKILHKSSGECLGLVIVEEGQLRAFVLSEGGKEITLFRLFELDFCLFTASCVFSGIQFDVSIEVEKDTEFWLIPPNVYRELMEKSTAVANYTNELMASRFSEVMWLIEQVMFKSFDKGWRHFCWRKAILKTATDWK